MVMDVGRYLDEKGIYRVVSAGILTGMCLAGAGNFFGIAVPGAGHAAAAAAVLLAAAGLHFLRGSGRMLLVSAAVISLGVTAAAAGIGTSMEFLASFVRWEWGDAPAVAEWAAGYELLQAALLAGGCYLLQILLEKVRYLKAVLAVLLLAGAAACLAAGVEVPHGGTVLLFFYAVTVYVEWVQERWHKVRRGRKEQMLWLLPFLALYLLLMAVMPAPQEPYDWQWAKEICDRIGENFLAAAQNIMRGGREDFGGALAGFSEEVGLGGSLQESGRQVMTIRSQGKLKTNVYLTGKVYDTFDGRQWRQTYHGSEGERFLDAMETLYAVRNFDGRYLRDYLSETRLVIRYEYFNTGYVFAPLKTRLVRGIGQALDFSFDGGDMVLAGQKGYGTEYEVRYYQVNAGQELFRKLLEEKQEPDEALWKAISGNFEKENGAGALAGFPGEYRETVKEHYLDEITVSEGVRRWLEEILGDAESDLEKLQAMEEALASFAYTRTPGEMPGHVADAGSFLDYFLLESRKGYCVHFATAFVLLARAEGIPARYVQGYCVPMQGREEVQVYSDLAHSWPEAYLEGVGWIAFEPTPGYGAMRYTPWNTTARAEDEESGAAEDGIEEIFEEPPEEAGQEGEDAEEVFREDERLLERLGRFLGGCIPAVLAGCALVLAAENMLWRRRYRRMKPEERFRTEVRRNLRVLAWLGLAREEQETLQELRERGSLQQEPVPLCFLEKYEDVVYGGRAAGEDMIRGAQEEREEMLGMLKNRGKWRYLYCRVRLWLMRDR